MFNFTTVVFDGTSPTFTSQTLRDGTPQVQIYIYIHTHTHTHTHTYIYIYIYIKESQESKRFLYTPKHFRQHFETQINEQLRAALKTHFSRP